MNMKCGTVAVIGKANAGKSTLLNVLVGEKVAIVSPKPQTTRDRILCVLNREEGQIVFADTPGIYKQRNELTSLMMRTTENTSKDVDAILYVHDGHAGVAEGDIELMKKYAALGIPMIIAYTKIDIMPAEKIPEDVKTLFEAGVTQDVYPISARKGRNLKKLEQAIFAMLPEGEPLFPENVISDKSEKFMIAEIMREKILLKYDTEIPHGAAIVINQFEEQENGVVIVNLDIVCEKRNHKAILIGKQGKALNETASFARQDMEKFLGKKVFLTVYVKVREDWRDHGKMLRELGYSGDDV